MGKSNIQLMIDDINAELEKYKAQEQSLLDTRKRLEVNEKERQDRAKQKAAEMAEKKAAQ